MILIGGNCEVLNTNETDAFLLRKTSITKTELGHLHPLQYLALLKEVHFQESVNEYRRAYELASLLAAIEATIPHKPGQKARTTEDFLSCAMPTRDGKGQGSNIETLAEKKGIILPSK